LRGEPPQFEGFGGEIKLTNFWARVFSFFRRDSERYRCRYCGHVFTKEEVEVAGGENYRYGYSMFTARNVPASLTNTSRN
jgi:hypothetical protein